MLFIIVKWQGVCGVRKVQMPFHGCCVSEGTLVLNYGATNVAPTQEDQPSLLAKEKTAFKNIQTVLEWTEILSWVSTGLETKNDCADEGKQQFTGPRPRRLVLPRTSC
jgi:hypothetical protein